MKPERAVNAKTGEIAYDSGCKLFEALRQIPPPPFTVKGEETTESGLFPARALYLKWIRQLYSGAVMSKKEKSVMPQSTAGLVRYFDQGKESIKIKPEHIIAASVAFIAIEIMLKFF